jgi:hypothetical protein
MMSKTIEATATSVSKTREELGFKEARGSTGAALYISKTSADHKKSMAILEKAELVPFTHQKILSILVNDEELKESLKGKWFYVAGKGTDKNGLYTIDANGELVERKENTSVEKTVRVWQGPQPLSLFVSSVNGVSLSARRFLLNADFEPDVVAPVVVGEPKQAEALLAEAQTYADKLVDKLRALPEGEQRTKITKFLRQALDETESE